MAGAVGASLLAFLVFYTISVPSDSSVFASEGAVSCFTELVPGLVGSFPSSGSSVSCGVSFSFVCSVGVS